MQVDSGSELLNASILVVQDLTEHLDDPCKSLTSVLVEGAHQTFESTPDIWVGACCHVPPEPPLPWDDILDDPVIRERVGKLIGNALRQWAKSN